MTDGSSAVPRAKIAIAIDEKLLAVLDRLVRARSSRTAARQSRPPWRRSWSAFRPACWRAIAPSSIHRRAGAGRRRAVDGRRAMARVLRGDIRWAELDPTRGSEPAGRRPVLV